MSLSVKSGEAPVVERLQGDREVGTRRPVIVIPARFSLGATALRSRAEVAARALVDAVWAAGGEPLILHPSAPGGSVSVDEVRDRAWMADGVLLPGGGDLAARWSGQDAHESLYDVDEEQDAFDLALASVALADGLPLLAVCRGNQVVNVLLGGDLVQDMGETVGDHRHRVHEISVLDVSLREVLGDRCRVSCYHHQCLGRLGSGLVPAAVADDGVVEAVVLPDREAWYLGVQWHPEDAAATDPVQARIFSALVDASRWPATRRVPGTDDLVGQTGPYPHTRRSLADNGRSTTLNGDHG